MSGGRILVVEDGLLNRKFLGFLLTEEGYEVQSAPTAEEALVLLETFHPRLILMDVHLPGMDGLELTRRLKGDPGKRQILIVALTASEGTDDKQQALDAGCDGYLTKPINTRTFLQVVAGYLHDSPDCQGSPQ